MVVEEQLYEVGEVAQVEDLDFGSVCGWRGVGTSPAERSDGEGLVVEDGGARCSSHCGVW